MKCSHCGELVSEGTTTCPSCGSTPFVDDDYATKAPSTNLVDASDTPPDDSGEEPSRRESPDSESDFQDLSEGPLDVRALRPGTRIDRHEIVRKLGEGGMGAVYEAFDTLTKREVALKFLSDPISRRARYEIAKELLMADIVHPNVCKTHDLFETKSGLRYMSMELIQGETLALQLYRLGRQSRDTALKHCRQLCLGLQAIHDKGIVHCDLKPSNLMIDEDGNLRITDFGVAVVVGSPLEVEASAYSAPEHEHGLASHYLDIYSVGLILHQILSGATHPPKHPEAGILSDPHLESVILQCLKKDPRDRPSSAEALEKALFSGPALEAATKVVVIADLSRYTEAAVLLDEIVKSTVELDKQIATLIDEALLASGCDPDTLDRKGAGDGQVILFDDALQAHHFAVALHQKSKDLNKGADGTPKSSRYFRIGMAIGKIIPSQLKKSSFTIQSGLAYIEAARLESACITGDILVSQSTWEKLPKKIQDLYGGPELIFDKNSKDTELSERRTWPARRFERVITPAPWDRKDVVVSLKPHFPDETASSLEDPQASIRDLTKSLLPKYLGELFHVHGSDVFRFRNTLYAGRFALACQDKASRLAPEPLAILAAIHQIKWPAESEPLAVEEAAKCALQLLTLATGNRILLTDQAFEAGRKHPAEQKDLGWQIHGATLLDGFEQPVEIGELAYLKRLPAPALDLGPSPRWIPSKGRPVPNSQNWTLEKELGQGGFGRVWLASRPKNGSGEEELSVFKFPTDPKRLESLKREEEILKAVEKHLSDRQDIAQLISRDLEGDPCYLQSNYVPAGSLKDFADEQGLLGLPLDLRVKIGLQIVTALQAAHSFGIIHGDLKPSNILMLNAEHHDLRIQLNDFGLGKINQQSVIQLSSSALTSGTGSSSTATWLYAAPEIIEGHAAPEANESSPKGANQKSDIYSLGVLLFQLVVGSFRRAPSPGWKNEIPSESLRETLGRVLDRSPDRRPTLDQVEEKLESYEAEDAKREEEQARKEARLAERRKRCSYVFVLILSVLAGIAWFQERRAQEAERKAKQAEAETQSTLDFLVRSFQVADPSAGYDQDHNYYLGEELTVFDSLETAVKRLPREIPQPRIQAVILDTIGNIYVHLGLFSKAEPLIEEGLALRRALPPRTATKEADIAGSLISKGLLLRSQSRYEAAEEYLTEALIKRREAFPDNALEIAESLKHLATVLDERGDYREAAKLARESLRLYEDVPADERPPEYTRDLVDSLGELASILQNNSEAEEAEELFRKALKLSTDVLGDHPSTAGLMANLALLLLNYSDDLTEAEDLLKSAQDMDLRLYQNPIHPNVITDFNNLGLLAIYTGRLDEAKRLLSDALRRFEQLEDENPGTTFLGKATTLNNLGVLYQYLGDLDSAILRHQDALALQVKHLRVPEHSEGPPVHRKIAITKTFLAGAYWSSGRLEIAHQMFEEATKIQEQALVSNSIDRANTLALHSRLLQDLGKHSDATDKSCQALGILKGISATEAEVARIQNNLALIFILEGELWKAESVYREALEIMRQTRGAEAPLVSQMTGSLGYTLIEKGLFFLDRGSSSAAEISFAAASRELNKALELYRKQLGEGSRDEARILRNLGFLAESRGDFALAERQYRRSLEIEKEGDTNVLNVAKTQRYLAHLELSRGNPEAAESLASDALKNFALAEISKDHWRIAFTRNILGASLVAQDDDRLRQAETLLLDSFRILSEQKAITSFYYRDALKNMINLYRKINNRAKELEYNSLLGNALAIELPDLDGPLPNPCPMSTSKRGSA